MSSLLPSRRTATRWLAGGLLFVILLVAVGVRHPGRENTDLGALFVFLTAIVVAEQLRLQLPRRMSTAPLSSAIGLAMALTISTPDQRDGVQSLADFGAGECVVVAGLGMVGGAVLGRRRLAGDRETIVLDILLRLFSVALAAVTLRAVHLPGAAPLAQILPGASAPTRALVLVAVALVVVLLDAPLRSIRRAVVEHMRWMTAARDELRSASGLGTAISVTGALIAICWPVLNVWALPLMMIPLGITQFALRRQAANRQTYRQTVVALSRLPEVVGLIPNGHADRVARLSVGVGRVLNMSERDVQELEYAARLHDIGQVTLRNPIPNGATVQAATSDQQRIADNGAEIVRSTDEMGRVAVILEKQAVPYHRQLERSEHLPLASRIIKVTNAFVDLSGLASDPDGSRSGRAAAMERIFLGLGYEYDPEVVVALERVLARGD